MMQYNEVIEKIKNVKLVLAPMAGITDLPFRQLARQFGADWAASEMVTDNPILQQTAKTLNRQRHEGENGIVAVQIAGSRPEQMAAAAQHNVALGAQAIDINMGCPAKKVCNVFSGSALLQDEDLVERILNAVVRAVPVPVTLKTRLGWDDEHKNILTIAQIAEQAGIAALAIHGRTRTQMYRGMAEYDLIAAVKQRLSIPVWANGDIASPEKAAEVLRQTGADAVMVGRGVQGRPWLFAQLRQALVERRQPEKIRFQAASETAQAHLQAIHQFYGKTAGVRIARKHLAWYCAALPNGEHFRRQINQVPDAEAQRQQFAEYLDGLAAQREYWGV